MQEEYGLQCMPCSSRIISEMLPDIHTMEKFDFLKERDGLRLSYALHKIV